MVKRINISFPEETIVELNKLVPSRGRSKLINEVVMEKLKNLEKAKAWFDLKKKREGFSSFEVVKSKEAAVAYTNDLRKKADRNKNQI